MLLFDLVTPSSGWIGPETSVCSPVAGGWGCLQDWAPASKTAVNIHAHIFGECHLCFFATCPQEWKPPHNDVGYISAEFAKLAEPSFPLVDTLFCLKIHVFPLFWGNLSHVWCDSFILSFNKLLLSSSPVLETLLGIRGEELHPREQDTLEEGADNKQISTW